MHSRPLSLALLLLLLSFVTDLRAAGRELGPRGGGPSAYNVRKPLTAFAGGRFLTVWEVPMGPIGTPLMGAFSDASGRRISDVAFPVSTVTPSPRQLVGTGDSFAMFTSTQLIDVDLEGRITTRRAHALAPFIDMTVEWNGSRFLAALWRPDGAEALLLDREGRIVRVPLVLQRDLREFAIVPSADGFTMIATGASGVFAYRIGNDGTIGEQTIEHGSGTTAPVAAPAAGGGVLAVWTRMLPDRREIRAADVSAAGTPANVRSLFASSDFELRAIALAGSSVVYADSLGIRSSLFVSALTPPWIHWATATNGSAVFVAYVSTTAWPLRVQSVLVNANGTAGAYDVVSFMRTRQTQPALGTGGGRFVAAWTDVTGEAAFVRAASLGADGVPRSDHVVAPAFLSGRELAWNGVEYLVVEQREKTLLASRVAYDGTPADTTPFPLATTQLYNVPATVVWAGHRWIVLWPEYERLRYVVVLRSGIASEPRNLELRSPIPNGWWRQVFSVAAAANGGTVLVAWSELQRPPCFFPACDPGTPRTFVTRFDAADVPLELPAAATLSAATGGSEFLVLGDATAHAIDATSAPRLIASNRLLDWPAAGDVTWDGISYAVALRYSGVRWYLSVTHLGRAANRLRAAGTETLPPDTVAQPSIAALFPGAALVALQEGDARDGARAVVYSESELATLPAPPEPPRNLRVTTSGDRYEVTWDAPPAGEVDHYRVEALTPGGAWTWVGAVAPSQPLRVVLPFPSVRIRAFGIGGPSEWTTVPARRRSSRP